MLLSYLLLEVRNVEESSKAPHRGRCRKERAGLPRADQQKERGGKITSPTHRVWGSWLHPGVKGTDAFAAKGEAVV